MPGKPPLRRRQDAEGAATAPTGLPEGSAVFREGPWSPGVLETLLPELAGAPREDPQHSQHTHAMVRTRYTKEGTPIELEVVDYQTPALAEKLVALLSADGTQEEFLGLPSYTWTSQFGFYHRNLIAGRVGLLARTADSGKESLDALLRDLVARMGKGE